MPPRSRSRPGHDRGPAGGDPAADRGQPLRARSRDRAAAAGPAAPRRRPPDRERRGRASTPRPTTAACPTAAASRRSRPAELTPGLLRAGILRDGCVLVRGLVDREAALALAAQIDRVFEARAAFEAGSRSAPRLLRGVRPPEARFEVASVRPWIRDGGGVLAGDSPMVAYEMLELFASAGLTAAGRRLPRRASAAVRAQDHAAQGRAGRSAAPGTRTARSWATCGR